MEKKGKANIKFIVSIISFVLLMAFFVFSVGFDSTNSIPSNGAINTTRNINFTFNVTWDAAGDEESNCSLWTNVTGAWASMGEFNGSFEATVLNGSANISNSSMSWVNYTFSQDIGVMAWSIACRNASSGPTNLTFFTTNRTLAIDTIPPKINQTASFFSGYNTTSATPTITFVIYEANGTGVNLTTNGDNATLNVTLYHAISGTDSVIKKFNISNSGFTCDGVGGDSIRESTCTLTLSTPALTNGSKNITISVSDRAGQVNITSFLFTVDAIPPALNQINITNTSKFNGNNVADVRNGTGSIAQGRTIYLITNLTDNLTQPLNISFQFWNTSKNSGSGGWQVVDTQKIVTAGGGAYSAADGVWGNASYAIPSGHNEFEGKNVSFRVVYNDTLGNSNTSETLVVQVNDVTAPNISIGAPANRSNDSDTTPTFTVTPTDISGSVFECSFILDSIINATYTVTSADTISNTTTAIGSQGAHNWSVNCTDVAGNSFDTGNITFTLDTGRPTITFSNANANNSNMTSRGPITVTLADDLTKVETITFTSSCGATGTFTSATAFYPFN
ncbi:MAG: Ig-like domain-containing protein, partial [Nanoarchaeota archaeon]